MPRAKQCREPNSTEAPVQDVQSLAAVQGSGVQSDLEAGSNSFSRFKRFIASLSSQSFQTLPIFRITCAAWYEAAVQEGRPAEG